MVVRINSQKKTIWKSRAANHLLSLAREAKSIDEAIQLVVRRLLTGIRCPPTDLDSLKTRLGVTEFQKEEIPFAGELRETKQGLVVVYSPHDSRERRQFTIAHELAHAIFYSSNSRWPKKGTELERLCDMLAAEILTPTAIVRPMVRRPFNIDDLFTFASDFHCSLSVISRKYADLTGVSIFEITPKSTIWMGGPITAKHLRYQDDVIGGLIRAKEAIRHLAGPLYFPFVGCKGFWSLTSFPLGNGGRQLVMLQRTDDQ